MYFDSGGRPGQKTLCFVHGMGGNMTHFEYLAPPLQAEGWRVCGLDLPGFGLSGKPHREYTISYLSAAVLALLDHLKVKRATLVGHSLGGLVCADASLRAPERFDRLVLISTAGLFKMPLPFRLVARTMVKEGWVAWALEKNARRILDLVFSETNPRTEKFVEQSTTRPDLRFVQDLARVMVAAKRDLTSVHLLDEAHRLDHPTLVIWGGNDRLLPSKNVERWTKALPDGELEVIQNCGHMSLIEEPERVLHRMRRFLARASRSSSTGSRAMASRAS